MAKNKREKMDIKVRKVFVKKRNRINKYPIRSIQRIKAKDHKAQCSKRYYIRQDAENCGVISSETYRRFLPEALKVHKVQKDNSATQSTISMSECSEFIFFTAE